MRFSPTPRSLPLGAALLLTLLLAVSSGGPPASADAQESAAVAAARPLLDIPVEPPLVLHGADIPAQRWLPGHRGADLSTSAGATVTSPATGTVTFAGDLAGRGVVVVTVEGTTMRTTLEPVVAAVAVGDHVYRGDPIGAVQDSAADAGVGHCPPLACVHWGLKSGDDYLDPLDWTEGWGPIRLKRTEIS